MLLLLILGPAHDYSGIIQDSPIVIEVVHISTQSVLLVGLPLSCNCSPIYKLFAQKPLYYYRHLHDGIVELPRRHQVALL